MAAMNTASYEKILIVAETLIQQNGYNAFSYKDIAQIVGIKNFKHSLLFSNESRFRETGGRAAH